MRLAALGGKIVGGERYWEEYYRKNVQNKMGWKSPKGANMAGAIFGSILVLEVQDCYSDYLGNYFSDYA